MFENTIIKETPRKTCMFPEQKPEHLKQMILLVLKEHEVSLSQTRELFDEIIITIEDSPIK